MWMIMYVTTYDTSPWILNILIAFLDSKWLEESIFPNGLMWKAKQNMQKKNNQ